MKKIKALMVIFSLIATIAVADIASALVSDTFDISVTVDSVATISTCGSVTFASNFDIHTGQISPTCNIVAASNNPGGFYLTLKGTNAGFEQSGTEWTKLIPTDDTINTSCTSSCTEEWGWRIDNGSDTGYASTAIQTDANNGSKNFDDASYWHTVNYDSVGLPGMVGAETFLSQNVASSEGANFDIEFGATTANTPGLTNYQDTITITLTTY